MTDAERITRIEERYLHQQRHMAEQDKVMLSLTEQIEKLRAELAMLRAQRTSLSPEGEMPDERPPHY